MILKQVFYVEHQFEPGAVGAASLYGSGSTQCGSLRLRTAPTPVSLTMPFHFILNFKFDFTKFIKSLFFNVSFWLGSEP
jgi:hypothetical protein